MKTLFETKNLGRMFALVMALVLCLAMAGCNSQKDIVADEGNLTGGIQQEEPDEAANVPGEPDDGSDESEPQARVTDVQQTDPEVHSELLKLDFEPDTIPESWYYRSTTDETGLACYEIHPVDSEEPVLIPMASTVIYMTEDAGETADETDDASETSEAAYYERITLTYLLDGEPVESVQYQIFVPNVYDMSVNMSAGE